MSMATVQTVDDLVTSINNRQEEMDKLEESKLVIARDIGRDCIALKAQTKAEKKNWGDVRDSLWLHQTTLCDYMKIARYWDEFELDDPADGITSIEEALNVIRAALKPKPKPEESQPEAPPAPAQFLSLDYSGQNGTPPAPAQVPAPEEKKEEQNQTPPEAPEAPQKKKRTAPKTTELIDVHMVLSQEQYTVWVESMILLQKAYDFLGTANVVLECVRREVERVREAQKQK